MRSIYRVMAVVWFAACCGAPLPVRAGDGLLAGLNGHWRCTAAAARPTVRSYFVVGSRLKGVREVFGRSDGFMPDGQEYASFERMHANADGSWEVESADGKATAAATDETLRFTGRTVDGAAPFTLVYRMDGALLRRTATSGTTVIADEQCTRDPDTPVDPNCAQPNVRARTIHAVQPQYPADAQSAVGRSSILITLDDRSRAVWAKVMRSSGSASLDEAALLAARQSTFQTEIRGCRPVAAQYIFSVEFTRGR